MSELSVGALSGLAANSYVIDVASGSKLVQPGMILQVVTASTNTPVANSSSTYADSGLSVSITRLRSDSKFLILVNQSVTVDVSGVYLGLRVLRDATVIHDSPANTTGPFELGTGTRNYNRLSITFVDENTVTGTITYKTQIRPYDSAGVATAQIDSTTDGSSYITVMEIA